MRHLGYGDQELAIESRGAEGHNEHLAELAAELVQLAPEVIVTGSGANGDLRLKTSRLSAMGMNDSH